MAEEVPLARAARTGRLVFPGDEEALAQARAARAALRRAGLRRYELSNFARPGCESRHNRLYWEGESYLGLGAGAAGCLRGPEGGVRWQDLRDADAWLAAVEAGRLPTGEEDRFDAAADRNERIMLGLRTVAASRWRWSPRRRPARWRRCGGARLAVVRGERLVLTSRGLEVQSAVAERLLGRGPNGAMKATRGAMTGMLARGRPVPCWVGGVALVAVERCFSRVPVGFPAIRA